VRVVGSDNEDQKRNPQMPSISSDVSTSSFCGTTSDDSTLLLGASKVRGYIILSVDDDFSIFPEMCHTVLMTTTKTMKLLSMIILDQKQHFSLQKKVSSKELRVQNWMETTKIVNLILRLYRENDAFDATTIDLGHNGCT